MSRARAWWDGLSDPERFRVYTRVALEVSIVGVIAAVGTTLRGGWHLLDALIIAVAAVLLLESRPELASWPSARQRRWAGAVGTTSLVVVAVGNLLVVWLADDAALVQDARVIAVATVLVAGVTLFAFWRFHWSAPVGIGFGYGALLGDDAMDKLTGGATLAALGLLMVSVTVLSLWTLRVVDDLERARAVEAELQVAQERLRFARDLHDVVGRGFSAVAVKSELAATLTRAGAHERAATEMDEVKSLAASSMEQMRALVRGYRDISLASEVAGATSLLAAAGCDLLVQGEAQAVPARFHEVAAWVVREGTTNIVKHSTATVATLTLGADGMSLHNDGAGGSSEPRSGQQGLVERLAAVGAHLHTESRDGEYLLEVRWEDVTS